MQLGYKSAVLIGLALSFVMATLVWFDSCPHWKVGRLDYWVDNLRSAQCPVAYEG